MSRIEDKVCKLIQSRANLGLSKYGVSMDRNDLSQIDWLRHLQSELLDAAIYIEKLLDLYEDNF